MTTTPTEPHSLTCADCHTTVTQEPGQGVALFIILAGYLWCSATEKRRCTPCRLKHRRHCQQCQTYGD